jgi:hypothetical protein
MLYGVGVGRTVLSGQKVATHRAILVGSITRHDQNPETAVPGRWKVEP